MASPRRSVSLKQRLEAWAGRFRKHVRTPVFARHYVIGALLFLLLTTLLWALLAARIEASNADQLVDPYLFEHWSTLHSATFPAAHTFLLKWPLFWLIGFFGYSASAFLAATVIIVLLTIGALVFVLWRIERRPLVFGTYCLALASALLLVPAQPYAGGLLPVNMAMLATRNIEYVVYILALVLIIRATAIKTWRFWLGAVCLVILFASDKLFLSLSIGGALLAVLAYALAKRWNLVTVAVRWLMAGIFAAVGATIVLGIMNASGLTHIVGQAGLGPYGQVHSAKDFVLGSSYALLGLLTNFGSNPAFDAATVQGVPHRALSRLLGVGGVPFVINFVLFCVALFAVWRLVWPTIFRSKQKTVKLDDWAKLSLTLVWATVAAVAVFVASQHYYVVDARYLSIGLFAAFITVAAVFRRKTWHPERIVRVGTVMVIAALFAALATSGIYEDERSALATINERNTIVSEVLTQHHVDTLVGDYWRVLPIRNLSHDTVNVTPLASCTGQRDILSSTSWQPNLSKHSFAYLLSLDRSLTDFPRCSLKQVVDEYGRPNASLVVAGSLSKPQELVLFYDHGTRTSPSKPAGSSQAISTVTPIRPDELPGTTCTGPTSFNTVAHQDDDLLFMNPDLLHAIKAGQCIRTVYLTAGDAGSGKFYWLSRQQGSEAAYSYMLGTQDIWVQRVVKLASNEFIAVANPLGNPKISLIFMNLPDGNVQGEGFPASNFESLARLESGRTAAIHSVDRESSYSKSQLITALVSLMQLYQPTEIRTQATFVSNIFPDHSDHVAVSNLTQEAYSQYNAEQFNDAVTIPFLQYIGYPTHAMSPNVSGDDLAAKELTFLTYAKFDSGVCRSMQQCNETATYGSYLSRQYQQTP